MRFSLPLVAVVALGCSGTDGGTEPRDPDATPDAVVEDEGPVVVDTGADDAAPDSEGPDGDAAPGDAASDAPSEAGEGKIPLFVAQGHAGRTTVSCDDGKTWVANRSDDETIRCFEGGNDCDHAPGTARGIAHGSGWFVATFGWGKPGSIRRSRDGVTWTKTLEGTTFGGMVFGDGAFLAASRSPQVSIDLGATWTKSASPSTSLWNVRGAGFGAGTFAMVLEDGGAKDLALSNDLGKTWSKPTTFPSSCGTGVLGPGGFAYGKATWVLVGSDGTACRSNDGGKTWSEAKLGGTVSSTALFTGSEFVAWGRTDRPVMYRSADGASWTATATKLRTSSGTTTTGPNVGAVARSNVGTFAAANAGWMQWYEKQSFYRSTDGVTWDALDKSAFAPSHPIHRIAFGLGDKSAVCK